MASYDVASTIHPSLHIGFSIAIWGSVVGCGAYMAWALFFVSFFLAVCHTGYMVYTFFKIPDAGMVLEASSKILDLFPSLRMCAVVQARPGGCWGPSISSNAL